jgi:flagellar secretion chaperone FliS
MFSSTPPFRSPRPGSSAYRAVQSETAVDSASPHKLISLLYEALAGEISTARGAIARRDIAQKARVLAHAVRIVEEGLAAPLDLHAGGEIAARLAALYDYLVRRLTHANLHHDDTALAECAQLVATLQQGWDGIAEQVHTPAVAA